MEGRSRGDLGEVDGRDTGDVGEIKGNYRGDIGEGRRLVKEQVSSGPLGPGLG